LILKLSFHISLFYGAGGEGPGVGPEFKPQYRKKKSKLGTFSPVILASWKSEIRRIEVED
jgi:hypothetical protein